MTGRVEGAAWADERRVGLAGTKCRASGGGTCPHVAAAQHKRAIEAIVRELAAEANVDDPAAMSQELCLIIEGAYVTRQVTGDPQTIAIARRVAESVIGKRLPTTAPSGVA